MSSEPTDDSGDPAERAPTDRARTAAAGARKRSFDLAEVSGYSTVLIVIGLAAGVVDPPGSVLLAGAGSVFALTHYLWRHRRPQVLRTMIVVLAAAMGFLLGYVAHPAIRSAWANLTGDCDDPVELTVLLPADGAPGFATAVEHFNERYIDDSKCKRANVTAYSAPWPEVQRALLLGWEADEDHADGELAGFAPQRDVGPRPDLWVAESAAQVELAEASLDARGGDDVLDAGDAAAIGWTPLVMAVPDALFDRAFGDGAQAPAAPLPELLRQLDGQGEEVPVVRSDPVQSPTALMFLASLYDDDAEAVQMEKRLARSAQDAGLGIPATDTDLLCKLAQGAASGEAAQAPAVLTTERALSRYNSGAPLGDECPFDPEQRSGYTPLYPEGLGDLRYQAARLHWDDDPWADERSAVAEDLSEWLANGEGPVWSPEAVGVRSDDHDGERIDGERRFLLGREPSEERFTGDEFDRLLASYSASRVPTSVLLAIDGSLSMGTPISGEGRTRFELAVEGVRAALGNLGPHDAAGLWTFPAAGGEVYDVLLDIAPERGPQDADLLTGHQPVSGVDLHRTLIEGVDALEAAEPQGADAEGIAAMVVLTDGADRDASDVGAVVDRVESSEVSLYVIAVGDASCRAANFADMTVSPQISCLEAQGNQIKSTFDGLFGQLWS
ncbi:MAG TPA: vWA domain-containing protein [Glycomyces sp.]|nr:vWA domain-containing protein [Glycomyces sp.]